MADTMNIKNGNQWVKEKIENNELFSCIRMGIGGETLGAYELDVHNRVSPQTDHLLRINAGFYGDDYDHYHQVFTHGIAQADACATWDIAMVKQQQDYLLDTFTPECVRFPNRVVEPYYTGKPWSAALKGKKVLVINGFANVIEQQYKKKREDLFRNPRMLPEFELIPYKSFNSTANNHPHSSWKETLSIMQDDISKLDFDIALLGCGAYGIPLQGFLKSELGKSSIYVGGAIQVMFGIKGYRWDTHDFISKLYNEHWIYLPKSEEISNYKQIESGTYWKP